MSKSGLRNRRETRNATPSTWTYEGIRMKKTEVIEIIARHTREVLAGLDDHTFTDSDRLADLGANSVDRADIVMLVQESLGLSVPRVELFGPKNIGELADLLLAKLDAK
jgi:polyketide biosynthesis acyl carrier protein